jgi:hypothetical protein
VRRWTILALIVLLLLLAVVAAYQIQLAGWRSELEDRPGAILAGP